MGDTSSMYRLLALYNKKETRKKMFNKDKIREKDIKKTTMNLIRLAQLYGKPIYELPIDTNMGKFIIKVHIEEDDK